MGLFDNIICKLPLPVESKEGDDFDFTPYEWETRTFQTKDLDNCMVDYEIRSDGHLCVWRTNSLSGKEGRWIESDFTGYVNFYDLIRNNEGEKDLWVEFKAHFILGKIEGDIVCGKPTPKSLYVIFVRQFCLRRLVGAQPFRDYRIHRV